MNKAIKHLKLQFFLFIMILIFYLNMCLFCALRMALTEMSVLQDVLNIVKQKHYMVLDTVSADAPETRSGLHLCAKKKARGSCINYKTKKMYSVQYCFRPSPTLSIYSIGHKITTPSIHSVDHKITIPSTHSVDHKITTPSIHDVGHKITTPSIHSVDHKITTPSIHDVGH